MSRIGKKPIQIIEGVTVKAEGKKITVQGPKGMLEYTTRPEVEVIIDGNIVNITEKIEARRTSAYAGLTRALIANMVEGVKNGYEKKLELVGVGFRAKQESPRKISMTLGFSHPVIFEAPEGVTLEVTDNTNILVKGIDKDAVGLTAARIRKIKKPEPYKGKGIKYAGERIRRKQGKSGKV